MSHVQKYTVLGHLDSTEVAILLHKSNLGPFLWCGDSW